MKKLFSLVTIALAAMLSSCCEKAQSVSCPDVQSDSAAVVNTILARRSVRKYQDTPVRRDQMETVVKCGINAPSGMNRQPWEVRIVDNPDYLNGCTEAWLAGMNEEQRAKTTSEEGFRNMFRNAPTVAFIAAPEGQGLLDCGLLTENMLLSAWSMGIGSCCLGSPIGFFRTPEGADFLTRLDFPEGYQLVLAIAFGYPDESPEAKPREESKVRFLE